MKKNYLYAGITIILWSTMSVMLKVLMETIPDLEMLFAGGLLAFVFLLIINIASGKIKIMKTYKAIDYLKMVGLGFLGSFLYSALYYFGISRLPSHMACILNYLWPIMIVLFSSLILKEKLTLVKVTAIILSFAGIVVLSLGNNLVGDSGQVVGAIACIAAAVFYGLFSVLNKKVSYDQNILMMIFWLVAAIGSLITGPVLEDWVMIKGSTWLGVIVLGVVVNAVAYLLWAIAINSSKNTAKIANLAYLTPFLSMIMAGMFLKEEITPFAVIALILIVGGILLQNVRLKRK